MGVKLGRWGGRLCGLLGVPPLTQRVFDIMTRDALDHEVTDQPGKPKALYTGSRANMAREIYGDAGKARYLDRSISKLAALGLISPVGSAHNGATQWYALNVDMAVVLHRDELQRLYPQDGQELGRIERRVSARNRQ